ncbi:MAG: hypothetical protein L3J71_04170 [Victivallaceae bacterium]|nr:hypothetical protein [Victivallaceae bacterium]
MRKLIISIFVLLVSASIMFFFLSKNIKTIIPFTEKNILKTQKDQFGKYKITGGGIVRHEFNKNYWGIRILVPESIQNCDLTALKSLPKDKVYDLWLGIPMGNLIIFKDLKIKQLTVSKVQFPKVYKNQMINLSAISNYKDLTSLSLVSIANADLATLPPLPNLISFSLNFETPSVFYVNYLSQNKKLKELSFSNVSRFKIEKNILPIKLSMFSLGNCKDTSILENISTKSFIGFDIKIDINLLKSQKTLKKLILKKCNLVNVEKLKELKTLEELTIINCKPDNIADVVKNLPIKKIKIKPTNTVGSIK